jgi:hypothetical protein
MNKSKKRSLSGLLSTTMFFTMFSLALQVPSRATAEEQKSSVVLENVNQNPDVKFSTKDNGNGGLTVSNEATTGGFSSSATTNTSYLLTPSKISGDFSVEATLKVSSRTITGTGGVIGVGAFAGIGANDAFVASVARGDNGARSYYQKADGTFGAGSPKPTDVAAIGKDINLKLDRIAGKYTVYINGESKDMSGIKATGTDDMRLGLVVCGTTADVQKFTISQSGKQIYSLSSANASQVAKTDKPVVDKSTDKPVDKTSNKPVDKPVDKPVTDKPTDNSAQTPVVVAPAPEQKTAELKEGEWGSIVFGASTSPEYNKITVDDANKTVQIDAGLKDGSKAGGKFTNSHDGISYYYTEVDPSKNFELSGDVTVNYFAKEKPDNQEGFGIMARDTIGVNYETSPALPSNAVVVGGYRGQIQSVFKDGIVDISGAGGKLEDVQKFGDRPANDGTATYKLTLKKTNTGYQVSVNGSEEKIYYKPKQLEVQNKNKIYVGFYAARVASITVSNIEFKTSDVATDPAGLPEPPKAVAPEISAVSLTGSAADNYDLKLLANVKGNVEVKKGEDVIYSGAIEAKNPLVVNTTLNEGDTNFDIAYTPDANENVTSADTISLKHTVTLKSYGTANGALYVSPDGKADATGTIDDPIDIYSAVKFTNEGQTIYLRGGKYELKQPVTIERGNDGTKDSMKVLSAYPNEKPVLDFGKVSKGFTLSANYWRVYGIDVANTLADNAGMRIMGHNNVIELVRSYGNGNTGIQITGISNESKDMWPTNNLVLNCESFDNRDSADNNADGFAAKLTVGEGNVFRGCVSHNNCDDGWDLYAALATGPIGASTLENCIAYGNGTLTDGTKTKGDGNGFKLGGDGIPVKHVIRNSIAFNNDACGITSNSNPAVQVFNCISIDNPKANFDFRTPANAKPQFVGANNVSIRTKASNVSDVYPDYILDGTNYLYNGTDSVNGKGQKAPANIVEVDKLLASMIVSHSGKTYDEILGKIANLSEADKKIATTELVAWGRFVWTEDYSKAISAVANAWKQKTAESIASAKETINKLAVDENKSYLNAELNKIK